MIKNFVLDTNVLLHDPNSIFSFEDNIICIPIYVIEEIDGFKRDMGELGRNARESARKIDSLRDKGDLLEGIPLDNGGKLKVIFAKKSHNQADFIKSVKHEIDDLILSAALELKEKDEKIGRKTVFVTKDINLRIRAQALGIKAVDYDKEKIKIEELYTGYREVETSSEVINSFYKEGFVELKEFDFYPNEYVTLVNKDNPKHTALARFDSKKGVLLQIIQTDKKGVWGIHPKNREQQFAFDLLLNDDIKLVTLIGKAGTGKTLLALAAGMKLVYGDFAYNKLLVSRPVIPLGKDIGYLPGDIEEKMDPWMKPIYDNLEYLISMNPVDDYQSRKSRNLNGIEELVEVEPMTYLRGRSIPGQFIIIDEAQNLTPHEVKTIITRVGEGTKIVLTGDPYQIDNPYLDSVNNGLSTLVQKFKGIDIAGSVTLIKGERSALAELASNLL